MSWNKKRKVRQKAPPPSRPTRRISDSVLMRILEPHQQESLSDLAEIYQKLMRQLGMKAVRYSEFVRVQSTKEVNDYALDLVSVLARWQKDCAARKINPKTIMLVIADGASLSHVMRVLRMRRQCVESHMRASLSIYSLYMKRCSTLEINTAISQVVQCCTLHRPKIIKNRLAQ